MIERLSLVPLAIPLTGDLVVGGMFLSLGLQWQIQSKVSMIHCLECYSGLVMESPIHSEFGEEKQSFISKSKKVTATKTPLYHYFVIVDGVDSPGIHKPTASIGL